MDTKTKALVAAALLGLSGAAAADPLSGGALPCEGNAPRDYFPQITGISTAGSSMTVRWRLSKLRTPIAEHHTIIELRKVGAPRGTTERDHPVTSTGSGSFVVGSLSPGEYVARSLLRRLRRDDDPSTHGTHPGCHRHAVIVAAPEPPAPPPTTPPEEPDAPEPPPVAPTTWQAAHFIPLLPTSHVGFRIHLVNRGAAALDAKATCWDADGDSATSPDQAIGAKERAVLNANSFGSPPDCTTPENWMLQVEVRGDRCEDLLVAAHHTTGDGVIAYVPVERVCG